MALAEFRSVLKFLSPFPVLGDAHTKDDFTPLDLSVKNKDLQNIDVSNSDDLKRFIWNHIQTNNAKVAYGGYFEKRGIYNRSSYFNQANPETERNIHLGVDLWIEADSPVFLPLDGEIHSFKNNTNYGDYGPTLIIKHNIQKKEFYTLYGHLSLESLDGKKIGQKIKKGAQIATLGTAEINGDYAPHLHFQIIKDIQNYNGDYPGVSNALDLKFYKENCPDPIGLLEIEV